MGSCMKHLVASTHGLLVRCNKLVKLERSDEIRFIRLFYPYYYNAKSIMETPDDNPELAASARLVDGWKVRNHVAFVFCLIVCLSELAHL